jgi:hypothetical protein
MPYDEREILEAVARGEMTPDEAARLFEEGAQPPPPPRPDDPPPPPPPRPDDQAPPPPQGGPARRVQVVATARNVRLIGDHSVTEASADGPHRARREGDTLVIEGNADPFDSDGFSFEARRPWHWQWAIRRIAEPLVVRVNPATPVDIELNAGSLSVVGIHARLGVVVAAGSARLDDVSGPLDIETRAGAVRISGRIDSGESRIRCEAGSVNVRLAEGSSVRVVARAELGRVRIDGVHGHDRLTGGQREVTIGSGAASLTVEAAMGTIDISSHDHVTASTGSPW